MNVRNEMTNKTSVSIAPGPHRAQRLRLVAIAVLLAGFLGGSEVYKRGKSSPDVMDDPDMVGFNRQEVRQMGVLYGRQGVMILEFEDALQRPATQAIMILAASVLVAGGCWHIARLLDHDKTPQ